MIGFFLSENPFFTEHEFRHVLVHVVRETEGDAGPPPPQVLPQTMLAHQAVSSSLSSLRKIILKRNS